MFDLIVSFPSAKYLKGDGK